MLTCFIPRANATFSLENSMFVRRTKYVKATKRRKGRKKKIVKNSEKVRYVTEREYKTSCDPYRSRGVDVHVKARKRRRGGRRG